MAAGDMVAGRQAAGVQGFLGDRVVGAASRDGEG
jgi:hypothetical protein